MKNLIFSPRYFRNLLVLWPLLALAGACQRAPYRATARLAPVTARPVAKTIADDPAVAALIRPYHDKVAAQMGEVLGTAPVALVKNPGESALINFLGDLQRARAAAVLGQPVALGVITNGAMRGGFPAGVITLGTVFEMMPFENELVVVDAPGDVVQQLFSAFARTKTPIAGATYAVGPDGQPTDIRLNGQRFDPAQDRLYAIALSDYLASGGDYLDFLKPLPQRHTGILLRNAIADQVRQLTKAGLPVTGKVEGRVRGF